MWSAHEQARYFRQLRPYLIASVMLLAAGIVYGITVASGVPTVSGPTMETLREFGKLFLGLPKTYLALAIFLNNGIKTLLVIVLGPLAGILPLGFLLVNGYIMGLVLHFAVQSEGLRATFLAIAPHGLFELPAILLGTSIGLMLGFQAVRRLFGTGERTITAELGRGVRFFLVVILPLFLLAAFIEAFVTASAVSR